MEGTIFTPRVREHLNRRTPRIKTKAVGWIETKREKGKNQLAVHKVNCKKWRVEHSRGRPRLKLMYQIGLLCSQAKVSVKQSDWHSDLSLANKQGLHQTPDYKPCPVFSQTYFGKHTAYMSAVWKNEISNLCRGRK